MYNAACIFIFVIAAGVSASASAEQLRDPTRPLGYTAGENAEAPLQLNSILIGENRRTAVINGQRAGEKERIGDIHVLRILPNRVTVQRNGKEYELKLHNPLKRQNAS